MMPETGTDDIFHELTELPSVGPVLAKRLYERITPSRLSDLLDYDSSRGLTSIEGIGPARRETIKTALEKMQNGLEASDGASPNGEAPSRRDRFFEKLRCPFCPDSSLLSGNMSYKCSSCGRKYNAYRDMIDFVEGAPASSGLVQGVMESSFYARFYEDYMRPTLTRLVTGRSMTEEYALATRYLELDRNSSLLDAGCGTGNFTRHFARHQRALDQGREGLIAGLDLSWPMLDRARRLVERNGLRDWIQFARGNAVRLPFVENSFTHVHCSGTLHLTKDIQATLQNFARVLEPQGTLVIGTFLLGNGYLRPLLKRAGEMFLDFHWFTRDELYDVMSRTGFKVEEESIDGDAITVKAQRL